MSSSNVDFNVWGTVGTNNYHNGLNGNIWHNGTISQGTNINTVPASFPVTPGSGVNYFNNRTFFHKDALFNSGIYKDFGSSAGGTGVWCIRENDTAGNLHIYWNTEGGSQNPPRSANGQAYSITTNNYTVGDSLRIQSAVYGGQNTAINWRNNIVIRPETTGIGGVGINRIPTTHHFEVRGRAAKTTGGPNWIVLSDRRLKTKIKPLKLGLEAVNTLRPVTFQRKDNEGVTEAGFIAQDVEKTPFKEMAVGEFYGELKSDESEVEEEDKFLSLDQSCMLPTLVRAVQELSEEVEKLKKKDRDDD